VVVGSGAGGGTAAAVLAATGAKVAVLEEGGHYTRRDFNMEESWAYPALYQEHGNRDGGRDGQDRGGQDRGGQDRGALVPRHREPDRFTPLPG